ncbi:MAG TPA: toll/interleukin-1 receptor domain-containing protein [Chitinophagaceae bacterium]|nr:toll/interleukin-1 receptor domain-containing protein [Chitinophagaceae bacterium]
MKYFVSYTTKDEEITIDFLKSIADLLQKTGKVFIDLLNNDSIDKQKRIFDEIDSCDLLLVIETQNVYKSKWVNSEIARAKNKNIPIQKISPVIFLLNQ